jgi:hypothetical protein
LSVKLENIFLKNKPQSEWFKSVPRAMSSTKSLYPFRDNVTHGLKIQKAFEKCLDEDIVQKENSTIINKNGIYLEFFGAKNYELVTKSLEQGSYGIRLLNVKTNKELQETKATVYIPKGMESCFLKKIYDYVNNKTIKGKIPNESFISSIENIRLAILESFWTGSKEDFPNELNRWYEVWIGFNGSLSQKKSSKYTKITKKIAEDDFLKCCDLNDIQVQKDPLEFPERLIFPIKANYKKLEALILSCNCIAEFRLISEPNSFFLEQSGKEQKNWVEELYDRINIYETNVSVCLLDTGLNYNHPLIDLAVRDENSIQRVDSNWTTSDKQGHGTKMAGIALYDDLNKCLASGEPVYVKHSIESVKILPDEGENDKKSYGLITQRAIALAELNNPETERIVCMAVTAKKGNTLDGSPTSWSAALDSIVCGRDSGDENLKRLFFVSAGNLDMSLLKDYPTSNIVYSIENPGQAWNAVTVGAWTNKVQISGPEYKGYHPIADVGELSPYSSTSQIWDTKKWPIKPEILLDGGNAISDGYSSLSCEALSLLTTNNDYNKEAFSFIHGTSSATAQASWMAAQLVAEYPGIWPETVRALLIHSAEWTQEMKMQICNESYPTKKEDLGHLLRTCGYGVPHLDKAIQCAKNSVNMIIQNSIYPYNYQDKKSEIQFYELPWPKQELQNLSEKMAKIKLTLSYFIEPAPGEIGWKDKYRYPSCGLRFEVVNVNETREHFDNRINGAAREKDYEPTTNRSWYLGPTNRNVGSVHSDSYQTTAANLSEVNCIAIYPVNGWWKLRKNLGKMKSKIRYSLVMTIETPSVDIDLYATIINQINIPISTSITY